MNDPSLPQDAPVCKPTKWFLWRALAMLAMFGIFAVLFLIDGTSGYRDKNLQYYIHHTFVQAGQDFQKMNNEGGLTEAKWKTHASSNKCQFPSDAEAVLPKDTDLTMPWPDALVDGYEEMAAKGGQLGAIELWEEYSASKKWSSEPDEHPKDAGEIRDQFIAAGVTALLIATVLFFLIRTMRRSIRADNEALYTQDGRRIAYADMVRIDKRKWDTKGLALVYYNEGEVEKKAKIDGMVYGQFKEEDGAPAEKLFEYVMKRFKGEVIEYVTDEEKTPEDTEEDSSDN